MTRLQQLFIEQGQSPWLDNIRRAWITSGELENRVARGVRGLTSNPSIFTNAILGSEDYDEEFASAVGSGLCVEDAYWQLVESDIRAALDILRPVYDESNGIDGYVSVEVDPKLARDSARTCEAARRLHQQINAGNLYVKIPATTEGLSPIHTMIAEHRNINVTLVFSLQRYAEVMETYISGLEAAKGDLSDISSVASFFVSRLDTAVDRRLDVIGTPNAQMLKGKAASANGKLAYELFQRTFSGPRWEALVTRGAKVQRPLWASTSTKNPDYPDTLYIDGLIGPDTVNTLPDSTVTAFEDHGTVARTIDVGVDEARAVLAELAQLDINIEEIAQQLETAGVASFEKSFDDLLDILETKADSIS